MSKSTGLQVCARCRFFSYVEAQADWSDVTPGNEFAMECRLGYWIFDPHHVRPDDLINIFSAGLHCPDFETEELRPKTPGAEAADYDKRRKRVIKAQGRKK